MAVARRRVTIAVVGTGASSLYLLKNLLERVETLGPTIERLVLFERGDRAGTGMPYHPATTDQFNLCNISSEELPHLQQPLTEWLRGKDDESLLRFGLRRDEISATETYARLALGEYFSSQFQDLVQQLSARGVQIDVRLKTTVTDLRDDPARDRVIVVCGKHAEEYDRVVIATGHSFDQSDVPEDGYYVSPWPIQKLLPARGAFHDMTIGTLGASLSAFDVVTSLAHRHGRFDRVDGRLQFFPHAGAEAFRIVMHSARGWLPHLQYEQCRPFREVYRYIDRASLLAMRDAAGFLRLQLYFDAVCRPVLSAAFAKGCRADLSAKLLDHVYSLEAFVEEMSAEHEYSDPFEGMKIEYAQASRSIRDDRPIYWKEALDDLMYTLSYHADLMPAEDHQRVHSTIMSFLMNVIAAMPLGSAEILLALRDAGRLDLKRGHATVRATRGGKTIVDINEDGVTTTCAYGLFVDCSGQPPVSVDHFPFPTLVVQGAVRPARARFADATAAQATSKRSPDHLVETDNGSARILAGIDIDAGYRVIGNDGKANSRIFDVAFPHTAGLRPYCYGLQACNHTAGIVVGLWSVEAAQGAAPSSRTTTLTRLHDEVPNEV